jgi:hypothetical protein
MSLDNLFKTAKKFEKKYLFAQQINQQDIGDAESQAFIHSAAFGKISSLLKSKGMNDCSVKVYLTINVNNSGLAVSANTDKFEVYCNGADFDALDKLNVELLASLGPLTAQNMLHAYQTNAACRKVLQGQHKENPIPNQVVVVKAQTA